MKQFGVWLLIFFLSFGGLGFYYHMEKSANPEKILIAVDESYNMNKALSRLKSYINELKDTRYTEYSIITNRRLVHSWQNIPILGQLNFYGPRDIDSIIDSAKYPEINDADRIIILTNTKDISGIIKGAKSEIVQLKPLAD